MNTLDITDKRNKKHFCNIMRFEDVGDIGTEYTFVPAKNDMPILSGQTPAVIELVKDYSFMAEYKITVTMEIPESADKTAEEQRMCFTEIKRRTGGRSDKLIVMRWANYSDKEQLLTIHQSDWIDNIYMSNVIEECKEEIKQSGGKWIIPVKPFEIITLLSRRHR